MAVSYVPAGRVAVNEFHRRLDDDVIYWKRMQQLSVFQEPSSVTSVAFCPKKPYNLASTSSVRLSLYDTVVCEPINLFSRFKQAVHGVKFRHDGDLIAIGGEEGKVRIFDVARSTGAGKTPLRSVRASQTSVRCVEFSPCGKMLYSMASDGMVKQWDIADTGTKPVVEFAAHKDAIRASAISVPSSSLIITGGYDHKACFIKVKLWDSRCATEGPSVEMDASAPVESVVFLNSEHLIATAAGAVVRIWDIAAGGRLLMSLQQHHKTVTSLCLGKKGDVLLSGGIDRRVNVFRLIDFSLLHSMSMAAPVLSLALSPDDETMAVGIGQLLAIHRREPEAKAMVSAQESNKRTMIRTAAPKVHVQEAGKSRESVEITAKSTDQHRLSKIDSLLKGYQHSAAVRKMFQSYYFHTKKEEVVAWLRVIIHRGAIHRAISGQGNDVLVNLLKFLHLQMFRGSHFDVLRHVVDAFFEVYGNEELHPKVAKLALGLKTAVGKELVVQNQLSQTIGALESIMNAARTSSLHFEPPKDMSSLAKEGLRQLAERQSDPLGLFGEPTLGSVSLDLLDNKPNNQIAV
ncbi:WD domain, G-beta repeat protein [Ancylostoma ceylanicum]|uniref:U3 small nucleolar RNA-associated protein 15 homolog n=2 Tax=Ancylostoma ceylanicum TaxID=53326 RepID=A0A0D6LIH0_9BILA|nr:WD domain, G-beta repeat protein [Ancylostoma ceylanicum]